MIYKLLTLGPGPSDSIQVRTYFFKQIQNNPNTLFAPPKVESLFHYLCIISFESSDFSHASYKF